MLLVIEGVAAMFSNGWRNITLILLMLPGQFGLRIPLAANGILTPSNTYTKLIRRRFPP